MRLQAKQFSAIAGMTALEAMRQPVLLLLTLSNVAFIALLPFVITHVLGESVRIVRDSSMALHFVGGLLMGSYAACAALSGEIRRGTASAILSKPVDRVVFFLAKFTGIAVVMVLFSAATTIATILSTRCAKESFIIDWWGAGPLFIAIILALSIAGLENFFVRRPFTSRCFGWLVIMLPLALVVSGFAPGDAKGATGFGVALPWELVPVSALISLAILVLASLAVALATRLEVIPTLSICSAVFMLGLMSDYLFGRNASANKLAALLYAITPNWQHFWGVDALNGAGVPWVYVSHAAAYAALYLAGLLALGIVAMRGMEVR